MIVGLMTLYQPGDDVLEHIAVITEQVDMLYLCDNSKRSSIEKFGALPKTKYIFFNQNLGLSVAFNHVLKQYPFEPDDYVIFFDQDSALPPHHVARLIAEYEYLEKKGVPVGCIGPTVVDRYIRREYWTRRNEKISKSSYRVQELITSSMLCRYITLQDVGFWNENVFLDLADFDLCWRMPQVKKICVLSNCSILSHAIGDGVKEWKGYSVREQSPLRDYYQVRESLYLVGKSYVNREKIMSPLIKEPILRILSLKERGKRIGFILRAWLDFLRGRHGAFR